MRLARRKTTRARATRPQPKKPDTDHHRENIKQPLAIAAIVAIGFALVLEFRTVPGWLASLDPTGLTAIDPIDKVVLDRSWRLRFLLAAGSSTVIAFGLGFLVKSFSRRIGAASVPRLWRAHARPVPTLGGIAIVAGIAGGILIGDWRPSGSPKFWGAAAGVLAMVVLGTLDDVRGLSARIRVLGTTIAAQLAWFLGLRVEVFVGGLWAQVGNAVITVMWFIVVTHAFNVFDNFDGATGGIGFIAAITMAGIALLRDQVSVAGLAVAVAGGCLGYLVHNVYPARLYMGDSGAYAIGFALAAVGLMLRPAVKAPLGFAIPVIAIGLPLFDVALVVAARLRGSTPVSKGGTDHLAHRLLFLGIRPIPVSVILWGGQILIGAIAVALASVSLQSAGWAVVSCVGLLGLGSIWLVLRLPEWQPAADEGA